MLQIESKYRSLSSRESEEIGRRLYREKNYSEAIKAFAAAITLSNEAPISALDSRAGTYEKLLDYGSALEDAKRMIRLDQANARGYLRAGKILILQEKNGPALKIYERGLLKVSDRDTSKQLLVAVHHRLDQSLRPPIAIDPLHTLPVELLQIVWSYLDYGTLVKCLRVSKSWSRFLENTPLIWTELDLKCFGKRVSITSMASALRRAKGKIRKIILDDYKASNSKAVDYLFARCPKLEHLEIQNGYLNIKASDIVKSFKSLSTLVLNENYQVRRSSVEDVLASCPQLRHVEFRNVLIGHSRMTLQDKLENLQFLRIQCPDKEGIFEQIFFDRLVNVHTLDLRSISNAIGSLDLRSLILLRRLRYVTDMSCLIPLLPDGLTHLDLDGCYHLHWRSPAPEISNLVSLRLYRCLKLRAETVTDLVRASSDSLIELHLPNSSLITASMLYSFLTTECPRHIEVLGLASIQHLGDSACAEIATLFPRLISLEVSASAITGVGIKSLITAKSGLKLDYLDISYCSQVSLDAVQFARANIQNVKYTMM